MEELETFCVEYSPFVSIIFLRTGNKRKWISTSIKFIMANR